jgi:hypothetical protein
MKNHVAKFSQFVNEMAKGDYFRTKSDPMTYGMYKGGSSDWSHGQPEFEPDDELSADEFMDKYGDDIDSPDFQNWKKSWKPDEQVKVWKGLDREGPKFKRKQETSDRIQDMSTLDIRKAIDIINSHISDAGSNKIPNKISELLQILNDELSQRDQ